MSASSSSLLFSPNFFCRSPARLSRRNEFGCPFALQFLRM
ncbi:Uncharacterised protein [Vibrio cholerae]|nr:Uncharacterised protein [Vibrio cholerae]